jgi:dTDP-4-dehydrorhamnose reductase
MTQVHHPPLQLWGGLECTVNRVGDDYRDQMLLNGHAVRDTDLELFARLGIQSLRYPVLWERMAPDEDTPIDWSWADSRLRRQRELGIAPILGLVHHGSGPRSTSLVANDFAPRLARYAEQVAERFPWVEFYTPINEPLTTARFSGLYGHWYPHERSDHAFVQALLNQCRATVLAMRSIRRINPAAKLIQTENLEKVHSTPRLRYQAEFENCRRWLSIDLLVGRVGQEHPLWDYLLAAGAAPDDVLWFRDHPCPPEILGWNYYLTSERFLDQRLDRYPASSHGGNGKHRYADIEAVRVRGEGIEGLGALLTEAWDRYGLPLAVTEVHLGCHRESQMRWLLDAWTTAQELRSEGIDLRAVTVWSLLGAYDWNSLCTQKQGFYESGVFDVRTSKPRATALVEVLRNVAQGRRSFHPALPEKGWWERKSRLLYPPVFTTRRPVRPAVRGSEMAQPPLLITGATGTLGKAFAWACQRRGLAHVLLSRQEMDISDSVSVDQALLHHRPWAVVNTAGYVRVDDAERDRAACHVANTLGPINLARSCAQLGVRLLTFSSDLVFDGRQEVPYLEADEVRPLCVYGQSKAEAERHVLAIDSRALVIRTSAFFSPWDDHNFATIALRRLARGLELTAAEDWVVSPTYVPHLVHACLDLLIDREQGLWHLVNAGATSWADFAHYLASEAGMDRNKIRGCLGAELGLHAPRPPFSAMSSARGMLLPSLTEGIRGYFQACSADPGYWKREIPIAC